MSPKNWPSNLIYNNIQSYIGFKNLKKEYNAGIEIRKINDVHSIIFDQYGLFAIDEFKQYDVLGQYTGELKNPNIGGKYVAESIKCCIDADKIGNEFRFINDYRNITYEPNVILKRVYIDKKPRVLIVVKKDIEVNEQILTDYGEGYWECINSQL